MSFFRKKKESENLSKLRAGDLSLARTGVTAKSADKGACIRVPWGMRVDVNGEKWMVNGSVDLQISAPGTVEKLFSGDADKVSDGEKGELTMDYFVKEGVAHGFILRVRERICAALVPIVEGYLRGVQIPSREGLEELLNHADSLNKLSDGLKGSAQSSGFALGEGAVSVALLQPAADGEER